MLTNKAVVCIDKIHGCQRERFDHRAKKLILKLKSEGISGGKIGSILRMNRFTVCRFLKRNESKEDANILTESARSQNVIEKDKVVKGLTEDF